MSFGDADEVGVGGVLVIGFGGIGGADVIREEAVGAAREKAGEGAVGVFPTGRIPRAKAYPHESEFDNGGGVEFQQGIQPCADFLMLGMGVPAAG